MQEAHDFAAIAHAATLDSRVPFLHFFDGFRTSHEVSKIEELTDDDLRALLSEDQVAAHRRRALTPDHPVLRGTAQNPDTFFQAREAANLFYRACPDIVEQLMARFAALTGRRYGLFEYAGHPEAERVIVIMGSGADTVHETVDYLAARGDKVGVLKVHLFRPFSIAAFLRELPPIGSRDRGDGPHQGTGRARRAAVSGRGHRPRRGARGRHVLLRGRTGRRGRPLRPVVQRVHARHGEGDLRHARRRPARRIISPSASWTT